MSDDKSVAVVADVRAEAAKYLGIVNPNLSKEETENFLGIAAAYGLNPFKREIHAGKMWQDGKERLVPITGYEVYLKRAERTGKLDGWKVEIVGDQKDPVARLTINRKDWSHPFVHEVYYREVVQTKKNGEPNHFWAKQPRFMLKKVAIGQGFRLCFPDELGGMPYTQDEMPIEHIEEVAEDAPGKQEAISPAPTPKQQQAQTVNEEFVKLTADFWDNNKDVLTEEEKGKLWKDVQTRPGRKEVLGVLSHWGNIAAERRREQEQSENIDAIADEAFALSGTVEEQGE